MPFTQDQLKRVFGAFSYREDTKRKGAIIIDPEWVKRNIVRIDTPFGRFPCHKLVSHQMQMLIKQGIEEGLINDIGGIWVPRHILWNPSKPLSGHSYGCDIDVNVDDGKDGRGGKINYGDNSYQPPLLLEIAKKWGFEWGGDWRTSKDGMHFSCIRIFSKDSAEPAAATLKSVSQGLPELRLGVKGADVGDLQKRLNAKGYKLKVDGDFGQKTAAALIDWQERQGFKASGRTDMQTWKSLGRA